MNGSVYNIYLEVLKHHRKVLVHRAFDNIYYILTYDQGIPLDPDSTPEARDSILAWYDQYRSHTIPNDNSFALMPQ